MSDSDWMDIEEAHEIMLGKDGLFVGLLTDEEREAFEVLVSHKEAERSYANAAGLLGLAKVKMK